MTDTFGTITMDGKTYAMAALIEGGFLLRDWRQDADVEKAIYALLNARS